MSLAPICLFTYKRLDCTRHAIRALKNNRGVGASTVYIFSDGGKNEQEWQEVVEVRKYLDGLTGFKEINRVNRDRNWGLAQSIIRGVSEVMDIHGRVIVLEDDLMTTPNFLTYQNQALDFYEEYAGIFSIAGYGIDVQAPADYPYDVYALPRISPWGWASWKDRWDTVDWEARKYESFKDDAKQRKAFNQGGSDLTNMLDRQMNHKLDSWSIRWAFQQFNNKQLTIFPKLSKVRNIGFGKGATHTRFYDRYRSQLDHSTCDSFQFMKEIKLHPAFVQAYQSKYSLRKRFIGRLKYYMGWPPTGEKYRFTEL